ncbi:MAG: SwmB domain-containing protein [Chloroflexi bacterium]|nr:SwmB domain-containing protein [Chloroflexota bacterium]
MLALHGRRPSLLLFAALAFATFVGLTTLTTYTQSPPAVTAASVEGAQLTISFTTALNADSTASASDFTVRLGDSTLAVQSATVDNDLVLTLESSVPDVECTSEAVTLSYSAANSSLTDGDGTPVAAFNDKAVTNNTDAPPEIVSLVTDSAGRYIYVTFCEAISTGENGYLTIAAFAVEVNGRSVPVNDVQIQSATSSRLDIDLGREGSIDEGDDIALDYDRDDADDGDPPQDANQGNKQIESWSERAVVNRVDSPPTLNSVTALYDLVTLNFSEELDEDSVPAADAFTIGGIQHAPSVEGVSVSRAVVTLSLSGILHNRDSTTYTLEYIEPNQTPLRQSDAAHNVADIYSFTFQSSTPTAKPIVTKAVVNGAVLEITFNLPLKAVAPASAFSIDGEDGVTISKISFANTSLTESTVTLTLTSAVSAGAAITVSYAKPDQPPRIEGRNIVDADSFTDRSVTNNTVAPVPEFSSAAVSAEGSTLTITFSLALDEDAEHMPAGSTFSLTGTSASVDSVAIDDSTVSLSLSPRADVDETVTVGYAPPTDLMAARLQSAADAQPVLAFTGQPVTNSADGKPRPILAEVDGDRLTLSFDRLLDPSSIPAGIAVSVAGTSAAVTNLSIDGNDLILTLSSAINHTERISVSYTAPMESPLKRDGKEIGVDSFVSLPVTNLAGDPTPTFDSASVAPAGRTLTIVMSHSLLATAGGVPDKSTFTMAGSAAGTIDAVSVSGSNVVLSLDPAADVNESVTISYQPPTDTTSPALQSVDAMWKTSAWTSASVTNNADGAPRPTEATVNGDSLVLTFDRALDEDSKPPATNFSLMPADISVTGVAIDGASVTLALSTVVEHDDTVTVSYSAGDSNKLKRAGKEVVVAMFTGFAVVNMTPEPLVRSVVGDGAEIVISFSVNLDTNSTPDASAFSLGSGEQSVSSVTVSDMAVTVTLADPLVEGANYTLTYTAPMHSPLQQSDGTMIADFSEAVTNNTDVAPTAASATGDGDAVLIEFDQSLDSASAVPANLFSITAESAESAVSVTTVAIDDDSLDLTLSRALVEDETASIDYLIPTEAGVADPSGNRVESFSLAIDNRTDTAPVPVSGVVEDETITVILDQEIYDDPRFGGDDGYPTDHFKVEGTDASITFVEVSNDGPDGVGKVVLTLSESVGADESLTIKYFPVSGTIRIRDDDVGQHRAQISNLLLTNLTPRTAEVESAEVDGAVLLLRFSDDLDEDTQPLMTAFSLSNGIGIESVALMGSSLTLRLAVGAVEDESISLSYTPPATHALLDTHGNRIEEFVQEVDNQTDYAPYPVEVITDESGQVVTLSFDQTLDALNTVDHSWFSFEPAQPIDSVVFDPSSEQRRRLNISLEAGESVPEGAALLLTYSLPESGGLRDDDAPNAVSGFTMPVINRVDVAPLLVQATANDRKLAIEFDQPLDPSSMPPPNCEALEEQIPDFDCDEHPEVQWFDVLRNNDEVVAIESVAISDSTVFLDLAERVVPGEQLRVTYSPESIFDGRFNLRDTSMPPHDVESIDPMPVANLTAAAPVASALDRKEPERIVVEFDAEMGTAMQLEASSLRVAADDDLQAIEQASTRDRSLMIHLTDPIPECASLSVAHAPAEHALRDASGLEISAFDLDVPNLIDPAWGLQCVTSDFGGLTLTFLAELQTTPLADYEWSLLIDEAERAAEFSTQGSVVALSPDLAICVGDLVTVRRYKSSESQSQMFQRELLQAAPCVVSAEANGVSLTLTFDQALEPDLPEPNQFTINGDASVAAVTAIDNNTLRLQLVAPGLRAEQPARVSYSGESLRGTGLTIASFGIDVIDVTAPPKIASAFALRSSVFLTFDQPLLERHIPASRFELVGADVEATTRSVDVSGTSLYLELSRDLPDDLEAFGLVYWSRQRGGIAGLTGVRAPDTVFVVRNFTETAPMVSGVVANAREIEVMFNQRVDGSFALPSDFTVTAGRRPIEVSSLDWSASNVTLTLAERVTSLDSVTLSYSAGEQGPVRDLSAIELAAFRTQAINETARPRSTKQRIEDAALRSSNGETTFARELARGFASTEGVDAVVLAGEGWTTVVRGGLHLSIDAKSLGDGTIRLHTHRVEHTADVLEQIASVPASCLHGVDEPDAKVWWVGFTDLEGVPTDVETRIVLSGEDVGGLWTSHCVLDLISGQWRIMRPGDPIVGPSLIVQRDLRLRPTAELWPLVR